VPISAGAMLLAIASGGPGYAVAGEHLPGPICSGLFIYADSMAQKLTAGLPPSANRISSVVGISIAMHEMTTATMILPLFAVLCSRNRALQQKGRVATGPQ
jgi:hypothetical protein